MKQKQILFKLNGKLQIVKIHPNKGIRYKFFAKDNKEYRFFWNHEPSEIELQVISSKSIAFKNYYSIVEKKGTFINENKKSYDYHYWEIIIK